jgi:hypothetical protein
MRLYGLVITIGATWAIFHALGIDITKLFGAWRAHWAGMNTTQSNQIHTTAVALDQKINALQNSYGVLSDADQQILDAIEKDSKTLLAQLDELLKPEVESAAHREGRKRDEDHDASIAGKSAKPSGKH